MYNEGLKTGLLYLDLLSRSLNYSDLFIEEHIISLLIQTEFSLASELLSIVFCAQSIENKSILVHIWKLKQQLFQQ